MVFICEHFYINPDKSDYKNKFIMNKSLFKLIYKNFKLQNWILKHFILYRSNIVVIFSFVEN